MTAPRPKAPIATVGASAYKIPTDAPESDGTFVWNSTTMVLVEIEAGGRTGIGYTYAHQAAGTLIRDKFADLLKGRDALDINAAWLAMQQAVRNIGQTGIAAMAISAVDAALWDLKGKLLGVSVAGLLGRTREAIPVYGSGGFTAYDDRQLTDQLGGWASEGLPAVKMKVGRDPKADIHRMEVARRAIGDIPLFIDANGALERKQALEFAERARDFGVEWFEEPVSSNDLEGLRLIRDSGPAGMAIAAGEYGFDLWNFLHLLEAGAVDVLQADATRCAGITGFMKAAALAEAHQVPLSSHCGPALHLHPCLAAEPAIHMEWFHDHVRIETMLFDGAPVPKGGKVSANDEPGLGLTFKRQDAEKYAVSF